MRSGRRSGPFLADFPTEPYPILAYLLSHPNMGPAAHSTLDAEGSGRAAQGADESRGLHGGALGSVRG